MFTYSRMLPGLLWLGMGSFTAQAQKAADAGPASNYRWYVGVHAGFQAFTTTSVYSAQEGVIGPVYGYLGYQLTPHLSAQVGYMQRTQAQTTDLNGTTTGGQPFVYAQTESKFNAAVPLLLRFRLARRPTQRLHLDALLGSTVLLHHYHFENSNTTAGLLTSQNEDDLRARNWYVTGGLSLGFALTPHLELTAEATNNWYLNARDYYRWKPQPGAGIGVRYRFNVRKAG